MFIYEKEAVGMESPKMQFPSWCKNRTDQYGPANYPFHAAPYRVDNENWGTFGSTYRHGTVFTPKQRLYQKEGYGNGEPKNIIF